MSDYTAEDALKDVEMFVGKGVAGTRLTAFITRITAENAEREAVQLAFRNAARQLGNERGGTAIAYMTALLSETGMDDHAAYELACAIDTTARPYVERSEG